MRWLSEARDDGSSVDLTCELFQHVSTFVEAFKLATSPPQAAAPSTLPGPIESASATDGGSGDTMGAAAGLVSNAQSLRRLIGSRSSKLVEGKGAPATGKDATEGAVRASSLAAEQATADPLMGASEDAPVAANQAADEELSDDWTAVAWLRSSGVAEVVASALLERKPVEQTELDFLRGLGSASGVGGLRAALEQSGLLRVLEERLAPGLRLLAGSTTPLTSEELHGKFVDEGVGFELEYGGLKTFFGGLEAIVGAPDPNVSGGVEREHCREEDSRVCFTTPNYRMQTTPCKEYWFVVDPDSDEAMGEDGCYSREHPDTLRNGEIHPRQAIAPAKFDGAREAVNLKLQGLDQPIFSMIEFVGARLYTGPMYVKYNTVLRGLQSSLPYFKQAFRSLCLGNRYTTTLHTINSAVVKLSKLTLATKVYRGVSNGRLPSHFRRRNEFGVRGGIDPAFMSTTLDPKVAGQYVGGFGVVFHIQQGMVDRGADISWLSQYPHEKEILVRSP